MFKERAYILALVFPFIPNDVVHVNIKKYIEIANEVILTSPKSDPDVVEALMLLSSSLYFGRFELELFTINKQFVDRLLMHGHFFIRKVQQGCMEPSCETCLRHRMAVLSILRVYCRILSCELNSWNRSEGDIEKICALIFPSLLLEDVNILIVSLKLLSEILVSFDSEFIQRVNAKTCFDSVIGKLVHHSDDRVATEALILRHEALGQAHVRPPKTQPCDMIWMFYSKKRDVDALFSFIMCSIHRSRAYWEKVNKYIIIWFF